MKKQHPPKQSGPLLAADAVGASLGVTGRTILNWEARGVIQPAIRVGRIVRFDLDTVKQQLADATRQEQQSGCDVLVPDTEDDAHGEVTLLKPQVVQNFESEPGTTP